MKVVNGVAQTFAEKSPVVVISGAPGIRERRKNPLLHHKVRDFDTQQRIFEHMTIDSVLLDNPKTAAKDIDRVLCEIIVKGMEGAKNDRPPWINNVFNQFVNEIITDDVDPLENLRNSVKDILEVAGYNVAAIERDFS